MAEYFISDNLYTSLAARVQEMNNTNYQLPLLYFTNNAFRQMILNESFPVTDSSTIIISDDFMKRLYNVSVAIQKDHNVNIPYHNSVYNNFWDSLMKEGACQIIRQNLQLFDLKECQTIGQGIVDQSLQLALSRSIEDLRDLRTIYVNLLNNISQIYTLDIYTFTNNLRRNKALSILFSIQANEMDIMTDIYLREMLLQLADKFNYSLGQDLSLNETTCVTIFLVFIILLILIYLLFWLPLATKINREVKLLEQYQKVRKSTLLLSMIPLNIIQKTKFIRDYINQINKFEQ